MAGASALSVPELKFCNVSSTSQCDRSLNVSKSLSKRHSFDSAEENWCLIGLKFHQYFNVYFKKKEHNIFVYYRRVCSTSSNATVVLENKSALSPIQSESNNFNFTENV